MRRIVRASLALAVTCAWGCMRYDGDVPVAPLEAELFEPSVISSELPEFAISFTPSGDTVFFNRTTADRSRIDLLVSVRRDGRWSEAIPFLPLEGVFAIDPWVTPDGTSMYFSSDLPRQGAPEGSFNLWRLDLSDPDASPVALPPPFNSDSTEVFNSIAADGLMVFRSERDGERAIYEARVSDDPAESARRVAIAGSSASNPAIHPSGRYLVFARDDGGVPPDLFLSCREGSDWGVAQRLPEPVNGPYADFAPGFDAEYLYFTSERPGMVEAVAPGERPPGDIYRVHWAPIAAMCDAAQGGG